ncbi:glutamate decarboxylase [Amycolatopsis thermoflava]|uniref:Glutamate decarboxylase n=1 Tax=Amycolatopsis thermoflava TaxID=84480 RepID=A0A3N2H030_9PSEU|nr:glutamate decarboxylase [Amycolatopsis thermoflava]ROS41535.1 glutamate decarboxylase [Amycolatopsis thermoflava]
MVLHAGEQGADDRPGGSNPLHAVTSPALAATYTPPRSRLNDETLPADTALQVVRDELMLDGNARLNLATFVTTWMEPQARELIADCADKNMIDKDEYPQTAELERRCVSILADLWHAPDPEAVMGCSTTGSSEACMLAGMALKRRWSKLGRTGRPNLVMGANVQVCWEKFCAYWEVEPRLVPMDGDRFHLTAEEAVARCDENTIGVVAILGSTFDGSYEPVAEIAAALDRLQSERGWDIPVHVDGASGAMIAPFLDADLEWDFRLPRVASINTSGHKYGLVYPGVGWVLWRDRDALPSELVFNVNYLGGDMPTFALNFSRPGAQVAAQYYNFVRLGREGFRIVQQACRDVATRLAGRIAELGPFELLTRGDQLPVFAFTTRDDVTGFDVFDVSRRLRERGWLVPAYTFPENRTDLAVLRIVCRNGFTHDLADLLVEDLKRVLPELAEQDRPQHKPATSTAFHH